jgi:Nuclear transport factor 2 (NTF2) domain
MKTVAFKVLLVFVVLAAGERIQNYNQAGQTFVQQYYLLFDQPQRIGIREFYDSNDSILVINGEIFLGVDLIWQKFTTISPFSQRNVTTIDCQPTNDAGVIVNVFGRISLNISSSIVFGNRNANGTMTWFNEMFVLKPRVTSFYIQNQYFRTSTWNTTSSGIDNHNGLIFV